MTNLETLQALIVRLQACTPNTQDIESLRALAPLHESDLAELSVLVRRLSANLSEVVEGVERLQADPIALAWYEYNVARTLNADAYRKRGGFTSEYYHPDSFRVAADQRLKVAHEKLDALIRNNGRTLLDAQAVVTHADS